MEEAREGVCQRQRGKGEDEKMSCLFVGSIPEGMICDMILKRGL